MHCRLFFFLFLGLVAAPQMLLADAFDDCRQNGDLERKIGRCTAIIECECLSDTERAVVHIQRAVGLAKSGKLYKALNDVLSAIEFDPNNLNAYAIRGNIYNQMGEYEAAIRDYDKLYEENFYRVYTLIARGGVYNNMGEFERATNDYQEVLRLEPDNAEAHNDLGASYSALGDLQRALSEYDHAIALDPGFDAAYNNRAYAHMQLGNLKAALEDAEAAVALRPNNADSHVTFGLMLCKNGLDSEAVAAFRRARDVEPLKPDDIEIQRSDLASRGFKISQPDLEGIAALEAAERAWIDAGCVAADGR